MARNRWHWEARENGLTLSRHWPPRMDLRGCADLAVPQHVPLSLRRLAQQVRQDLWRRLRCLRGFSPVVTLERESAILRICAGGVASRPLPPDTESEIITLLSDPVCNERWIRCAGKGIRS